MALLFVLFLFVAFCLLYLSSQTKKEEIVLTNAQGKELRLEVEVAGNPVSRAKGLMGRNSLGEHQGMLFVFDKPGKHSFWMFNTTLALDAVYIAEDGRVVDVIEMEPCGLNITNCPSYVPKTEALWVLEVNQGFSRKNKIIAGNSTAAVSN